MGGWLTPELFKSRDPAAKGTKSVKIARQKTILTAGYCNQTVTQEAPYCVRSRMQIMAKNENGETYSVKHTRFISHLMSSFVCHGIVYRPNCSFHFFPVTDLFVLLLFISQPVNEQLQELSNTISSRRTAPVTTRIIQRNFFKKCKKFCGNFFWWILGGDLSTKKLNRPSVLLSSERNK